MVTKFGGRLASDYFKDTALKKVEKICKHFNCGVFGQNMDMETDGNEYLLFT